ncbi:MAG: hypothetical protein J6X03_01090 [Bacilli bacterium]|nr:hypothetical protein [Bacilli bacterium]
MNEVNDEVKDATAIILPKATLYIVDGVNKAELKEKIAKEIEILKSEIKRSEGMLNNKNFLDKAPEAKVNLEKEKYQNFKQKLSQLETKLNNL